MKDILSCYFYKLFLKHPSEKKMTYLTHMKHAFSIIFKLVYIIFVLSVHAFLPSIWETKGSDLINHLNLTLKQHKEKDKE
jgi:hypothetical protein